MALSSGPLCEQEEPVDCIFFVFLNLCIVSLAFPGEVVSVRGAHICHSYWCHVGDLWVRLRLCAAGADAQGARRMTSPPPSPPSPTSARPIPFARTASVILTKIRAVRAARAVRAGSERQACSSLAPHSPCDRRAAHRGSLPVQHRGTAPPFPPLQMRSLPPSF